MTTAATTQTHPTFNAWAETWRRLFNAYAGEGGFRDGTYLVAHPREWLDHDAEEPKLPTKKLKARRALARYDNLAATIVNAKRSALFRQTPSRTVQNEDARAALEAWWNDVDGQGTHIDDFLADAWIQAGVFGHCAILADEREGAPGPLLRVYSPLDMADWLHDIDGRLIAVKLLEGEARESFSDPVTAAAPIVRTVDTERWTVTAGPKVSRTGPHSFGTLPVVILFAQRRPIVGLPGQSVLHDPQLFVDLYNLTSEIRELLRNQTFGLLNVALGTGADAVGVEQARTMLGSATGSEQVLFTPLAASYVQPESGNVTVYMQERDALMRSIFRLAAVPWQADSRDAEAEGSLLVKREDMNQALAAYADELESTDYALLDLFYRQRFGADVGPSKLKADQVTIRYPDTFDVTPLEGQLQEALAALALDFPPAVRAEIQKRMLDKVLPDLSPERKDELTKEIEKGAVENDPTVRMRKRVEGALGAVRSKGVEAA